MRAQGKVYNTLNPPREFLASTAYNPSSPQRSTGWSMYHHRYVLCLGLSLMALLTVYARLAFYPTPFFMRESLDKSEKSNLRTNTTTSKPLIADIISGSSGAPKTALDFPDIQTKQNSLTLFENNEHLRKSDALSLTAATFNQIYNDKTWTSAGGGSGTGSTPRNAIGATYILRLVMWKYGVRKLLDAPCGAAAKSWTAGAIAQLHADHPADFKYHGIDVVKSVVEQNSKSYTDSPFVSFSQVDLSATGVQLPSGYDLILSRDALQHLPYGLIARSFQTYCSAATHQSGTKYILIGSYLNSVDLNADIAVGSTFVINLLVKPFHFPPPLEVFPEPIICEESHQKYLLLYNLPNLCTSQPMIAFIKAYTDIA